MADSSDHILLEYLRSAREEFKRLNACDIRLEEQIDEESETNREFRERTLERITTLEVKALFISVAVSGIMNIAITYLLNK